MTEPASNLVSSKTRTQIWLENLLLGLYLAVIGLRVTLTDSIGAPSAGQAANLAESIFGLTVSAVLIFSFVLWIVRGLLGRRFVYRGGFVELGLIVFAAGAVLAGFFASDKRYAVTDFLNLAGPILMAVVLAQILDSPARIKLILITIAALAVVCMWQGAEQFFYSNQMTIERYRQAPEKMLGPLGITAGSFNHFLFEHRLYSRGVRSFFTTSNSAGSFMILGCFAAMALFADKWRNRRGEPLAAVGCGLVLAAVLFGLAIIRSKGAIAAFLVCAVIFFLLIGFGDWIKAHRKIILLFLLLLVVAIGGTIVTYGLSHGRLPGGNSMLVRWQYWKASVKMYAEHLFTGVGPGNFGVFYPHYKPAAGLETVTDPHNFVLSILTQYGLLGLAGFIIIFFVPLYRSICPAGADMRLGVSPSERGFRRARLMFLVFTAAVLLFIRPIVFPIPFNESTEVIISAALMIYIMPVIIFVVGFVLLIIPTGKEKPADTNILTAATFCAVLAVLLHNLIDFAIFEPGVFIALCGLLAALIASDYQRRSRKVFSLKPSTAMRISAAAAGVILIGAYCIYVLIPVAKSTGKIYQANRAVVNGEFETAHRLLESAANEDRLSSTALSMDARLYLQEYFRGEQARPNLLIQAVKQLLPAVQRSPADFKNYERLMDTYIALAQSREESVQKDFFRKAFDMGSAAVVRYPGSGRLHFKLAGIAEQLGKNDTAIENYRMVVEIEDAYREQFKTMYPNREIFSRLGRQRYDYAKERLAILSERTRDGAKNKL
ncbi:MAG: O-antigen ligase family protein [Planctomycetota bacterium]|jgi:O-antigen ligase